MDGTVLEIAQRLQRKLEGIDPAKDRDTLVWAHGFFTGLVSRIETRLPEINNSATLTQRLQASLAELKIRNQADDPDSLERIERKLGGLDDAPVPARREPGPKGLRGGAMVEPPDAAQSS